MRDYIVTVTVLLVVAGFVLPSTAGPIETTTAAVERLFSQASEVSYERVSLTAEMDARFNEADLAVPDPLLIWTAVGNDDTLGWAIVRKGMGRYDPFWIAVGVDTAFTVQGVEVLEYRSSHGGEVQRKSWLDQFIGSDDPAMLKPGRDIDAISGATLSVRSLSEEVGNALRIIRILHNTSE